MYGNNIDHYKFLIMLKHKKLFEKRGKLEQTGQVCSTICDIK